MRYNVSEETMHLENIITEAFDLLQEGKIEEAKNLLKDENDKINESYE